MSDTLVKDPRITKLQLFPASCSSYRPTASWKCRLRFIIYITWHDLTCSWRKLLLFTLLY